MKTIAIVGIDGSGKSTVVSSLSNKLKLEGIPYYMIDKWDVVRDKYPECRFMTSAPLEEMKVCIAEMPMISRWPFLFWTFAQSCSAIESANADIAIFDGHWIKHACAEESLGYPGEIIEAMARTLPIPDTTILLDIDPHLTLQRKRGNLTPYECGLDPQLSEARFLVHQTAVRQRLRARAAHEGWLIVDATAEKQLVLAAVLDRIAVLLDRSFSDMTATGALHVAKR